MRALWYVAPGHLELRATPVPEPRADEVVIQVGAAGVCGSDLHGYLGKSLNRKPPLVMGHELAGTVMSVGEDVRDFKAGTAVTVYPLITCGSCPACRRGDTSQCPSRQVVGIHRPGGFAEFVSVPRACAVPLPSGVPVLTGSLAEPLANAVHIFNGSIRGLVSRIAIFGAGTQGLMALRLARLLSPAVLIAVDIVPARLEVARRAGATCVVNARAEDVAACVRGLTGGEGVDLAIEAVGATTARQAAVASVRTGGTVALLGLGEEMTPFNAVDIVNREITLRGSYAYTYPDFVRAVEMLASGLVDGKWAQAYPLEAGPEVFHQLTSNPGDLIKAILTPN